MRRWLNPLPAFLAALLMALVVPLQSWAMEAMPCAHEHAAAAEAPMPCHQHQGAAAMPCHGDQAGDHGTHHGAEQNCQGCGTCAMAAASLPAAEKRQSKIPAPVQDYAPAAPGCHHDHVPDTPHQPPKPAA
ncbi:MAG TPA: hypothetical protein VI279_02830 [Rhodocyclaceae bacterium]